MKRYLPRFFKDSKGFTLIELLVVIAIIAILAIVGIVLFTSSQSKARDSKRIQDIAAMAKAMEVNYKVGTGYSTALSGAWFSDGVVPTNPGPGGATYSTGTPTTAGFTFCASLENSTGNATDSIGGGLGATAGTYFCRKNQQ